MQLSLRCVLQSFLLFLVTYTINAWPKSCFPSFWESASVVPVFKSDGERFDPGKYHAISLLPIISKIFESFINDSLTKHRDITGLSSDLQYGFCAFPSTADILTVLSEHIYNLLDAGCRWRDAGGEMSAIVLDISKAFDKVWHVGWLHKLKAYDVVGQILSILESFLQERSLKVVLDGQSSPHLLIFSNQPRGNGRGLRTSKLPRILCGC